MYFAHCLSIESGENTHRLRKSVTGRSTGLRHGGLAIDFSYDKNSFTNWIEKHSCFNQLMIHGIEGLPPEMLSSCNEFGKNLNVHNKSLSHSISWKFNSWKVVYCSDCAYLIMFMIVALKIEAIALTRLLGSCMLFLKLIYILPQLFQHFMHAIVNVDIMIRIIFSCKFNIRFNSSWDVP